MQGKHDSAHSTKNVDFPLTEKMGSSYILTTCHMQKVAGVVFKPLTAEAQKSMLRY